MEFILQPITIRGKAAKMAISENLDVGGSWSRRIRGLSFKAAVIAIAAPLFLVIVAFIVWQFDPLVAIAAMVGLSFTLLLATLLAVRRAQIQRQSAHFRRLELSSAQHYRQLEALISLTSCIDPIAPLPVGRSWAASPDFLRLLATEILAKKPSLVVELGGGYSSIVIGYCLQQNDRGRLISLDHDNEFAQMTSKAIEAHDLTDQVSVIHAPLREHLIDGDAWKWYDFDALPDVAPIDILVVDGPPAAQNPLARFPALPLFVDRLAQDAVVMLDDGVREGERTIVERRTADHELSFQYHALEKGAFTGRCP